MPAAKRASGSVMVVGQKAPTPCISRARAIRSHELTHHMEQRSGLHALDDRDAEELAAWRQEYESGDSTR